jgi:hypothetical protein
LMIWGRSCNSVITGARLKSYREVKRKNEFQGRFQQKQEEHPRILGPRHISHRGAIIDRRRLRAGQHKHDNDLHRQSVKHGVAVNVLGL